MAPETTTSAAVAAQGDAGQQAGSAATPAADTQQQAAGAGQESAPLLQLLEGDVNLTPEEHQAISKMLVKLDAAERKELLPKFMSKALSKRMKGSREREAALQNSLKEAQAQLEELRSKLQTQPGLDDQLPEGLEDLDETSRSVAQKLMAAQGARLKELQERLDAIERPQKERAVKEQAQAYIQEVKAVAPNIPDFAIAALALMHEEGGSETDPLQDAVELQGEWLNSIGQALHENNPAVQASILKYLDDNYEKDSGFIQALLNKLIPLYREGKLKLAEKAAGTAKPTAPGAAGQVEKEPMGVWALQ